MTEKLKNIALEILEKYSQSEGFIIADRAIDQAKEFKELNDEVADYRVRIESAE